MALLPFGSSSANKVKKSGDTMSGNLTFPTNDSIFFNTTSYLMRYDSGEGKLLIASQADNLGIKISYGGASGHFILDQYGQGTVIDVSSGNTAFKGGSNTTRLDINNSGIIDTYNSISTAGNGVPSIYGSGRATAQVAANASVATYTVGASDGSFIVSANVLVTTATTHAFTVQCTYTDEGNTARTLTFNFTLLAGTFQTLIANANGAVPYEGIPMHIRAKAATAITILTQAAGTYTTVTYNVEGAITQIA